MGAPTGTAAAKPTLAAKIAANLHAESSTKLIGDDKDDFLLHVEKNLRTKTKACKGQKILQPVSIWHNWRIILAY